jgi:hypothetical protein
MIWFASQLYDLGEVQVCQKEAVVNPSSETGVPAFAVGVDVELSLSTTDVIVPADALALPPSAESTHPLLTSDTLPISVTIMNNFAV